MTNQSSDVHTGAPDLSDASTYRTALAFAAAPSNADAPVRLAAAVRRLAHVVTGTNGADADLDDVAAAVEALADRLEPHGETSRYVQGRRIGGAEGVFITHPLIGATNPGAPPLAVEPDGECLHGHAVYGPIHEGPPGFVHGGVMAAAFDAMVVMTAGINGLGGLTRSLAIRYRKPAPLERAGSTTRAWWSRRPSARRSSRSCCATATSCAPSAPATWRHGTGRASINRLVDCRTGQLQVATGATGPMTEGWMPALPDGGVS